MRNRDHPDRQRTHVTRRQLRTWNASDTMIGSWSRAGPGRLKPGVSDDDQPGGSRTIIDESA